MPSNTDVQVELLSPAGELPLRIRSATGRTGFMVSGVQSGLVLLVALLIWVGAIPVGGAVVAMAVAAVGVFLLTRGVLKKGGRREFLLDAQTVEQTGGPGGTWSEPISAYRGVRWRRHNLDLRGNMKKVRQRHLVDLVHDDPARTVPLFSRISGRADVGDTVALIRDAFGASASDTKAQDGVQNEGQRLARQASGADVRDVWENLATLLGVPAIDARGDEEEIRDTSDLDKSIGELAAKDKASFAWKDTLAPPSLDVQSVDDADGDEALKVEIRASSLPKFVKPLFIGLGAVMVVLGILGAGFGLAFFGLLLIAAPFGIAKLQTSNPRVLIITRRELRHENPLNRRSGNFALALDFIESVHIETRNDVEATGSARNFLGKELVLSTDTFEHRIGAGLDDQALSWLRDYIRSAIANA